MAKRVTKATATAAVRKYATGIDADRIEVDSETVTVWLRNPGCPRENARVSKFMGQLAAHCGAASTSSDGWKHWCYYKRQSAPPVHDWCDRHSPDHY